MSVVVPVWVCVAAFCACIVDADLNGGLWSQPEATVQPECLVPDVSVSGEYVALPAACCGNDQQSLFLDPDDEDTAECAYVDIPGFNKKQCGENGMLNYGERCNTNSDGQCSCQFNGEFSPGVCYAVAGFPGTKFFFRSGLCAEDNEREAFLDVDKVESAPGGSTGKLWRQASDTVPTECKGVLYSEVPMSCCDNDQQEESVAFEEAPQCELIQLGLAPRLSIPLFQKKECLGGGLVAYGEDCTMTARGECECDLGKPIEIGKCYIGAGTDTLSFFLRIDSCDEEHLTCDCDQVEQLQDQISLLLAGLDCDDHADCAGMGYCSYNTGTCKALKRIGETCNVVQRCAEGLTCDGVCVPE